MPDTQTIYSVQQVNLIARQVLESYSFWVRGEVSNASPDKYAFKYFSLKDGLATIACIFPSAKLTNLGFSVEDGMQLTVFGTLSLYERDGKYQMKVEVIKQDGAGDLQAKIEAIKLRLQTDGLFSQERKRKLPIIPKKIAVITARESAAWKDFYKIIRERYPNVEILLHDVLVQGDKAPQQIINALAKVNTIPNLDLIVITRGGGSLEDLMAFNDESLARAIAASTYPVVSAVGHEKDISIADLVADLRASTPSNAAELIVPDKNALYQMLDTVEVSLHRWINQKVLQSESQLQAVTQRSLLLSPQKFLRIFNDRLLNVGERLITKNILLERIEHSIETMRTRIKTVIENKIVSDNLLLEKYQMKLEKFDPSQILEKGYTITVNPEGKIVKNMTSLHNGDTITTILQYGKIRSTILELIKNE